MRTIEDEQKKEIELSEKKLMSSIRRYIGFVIFYVLFLLAITAYFFQSGQYYLAGFEVLIGLFFIWFASGNVIMSAIALNFPSDISSYSYFILEVQANKYLDLLEKLPIRKAPARSVLYWHIANANHQSGKYAEAEHFYRLSIKYNKFPLLDYPHLFLRKMHLVGALNLQTKFDEVEEILNECDEILEKADVKVDKRPLQTILDCHRTGFYMHRGDFEKAKKYSLESVKSLRSDIELPNFMLFSYWNSYKAAAFLQSARIQLELKEIDSLEVVLEDFFKLVKINPKILSGNFLLGLSQLADKLNENEETELAQRVIELAYLAGSNFPEHPHSSKVLDSYEEILKLTDREQDIADMRKWILPSKNSI